MSIRHRAARALVLAGLFLSLAGLGGGARADEDTLRYVVRKDDTLIGLGQALFENPHAWPEVQRLNRVTNPRRIPIGTVLSIPVRLLRKVPLEGRVVFAAGQTQLDGAPVEVGAIVGAGGQLVTGERSFLTVELPDGSRLTMQPRSEVRIESLHGYAGADGVQRADLSVNQGRVETDVQAQRGPAARYRIQTPTAVIGVRGTSFRVSADAAVSRTEMRAGSVAVTGAKGGRRPVRLSEGYGLVAEAGKPLSAPVALLAAPDLSELPRLQERPLVRFELAPIAGAIAYRGQVAADAGFTRILAEAHSAVPEVKFDGLPDGDYFMRVRGIDPHGLEGRDAQMAFRLKARPEPPVVNAPRADSKVRAGRVDFAWTRPAGAERFRFELAGDSDFAEPLVAETDLTGTGLTRSLETGTYVWRLGSTRADGDRGPWGDPVTLTVRPPMADVPPPAFDADHMYFAWSGDPGQRFEYQLAEDDRFDTLVASGEVGVPELSLPRPGPGAYFLRLRAIDPDGFVGAYSSAQQVIVPAQTPGWLLGVPLLLIFL